MTYYLAQGVSQSIYDLTGNIIILSLWSEINASPINAMHGGYGIGAMLATQLAKPFIKFHPLELSSAVMVNKSISPLKILKTENSSQIFNKTQLNEFIDLRAPYWIAGSMSIILTFLFLVSHAYEAKNKHKFEDNQRQFILLNEDSDTEIKSNENPDQDEETTRCGGSLIKTIQKLLFADKIYEGKALFYMLIQISLFIISNLILS